MIGTLAATVTKANVMRNVVLNTVTQRTRTVVSIPAGMVPQLTTTRAAASIVVMRWGRVHRCTVARRLGHRQWGVQVKVRIRLVRRSRDTPALAVTT